MTRHPEDRDFRETAREALRIAAGAGDPDVGRLVDAFPAIMAEAGRRRRLAAGEASSSAIIPIARRAIPRLAAVAAAVVIAAALFAFRDSASVEDDPADLERAILTGASGGTTSNLLLDALTAAEKIDG